MRRVAKDEPRVSRRVTVSSRKQMNARMVITAL